MTLRYAAAARLIVRVIAAPRRWIWSWGVLPSRGLPDMTAAELDDFERLLALPDPLLTQWFSQAGAPEETAFAGLIVALRSYHGLAAMPAEGPEQA